MLIIGTQNILFVDFCLIPIFKQRIEPGLICRHNATHPTLQIPDASESLYPITITDVYPGMHYNIFKQNSDL